MTLKADHIRKLKMMNTSSVFDSAYIVLLLSVVFKDDVLQVSSAGGGVSNFNGKSSLQLDPIKLKFIEGIFIDFTCEETIYVFFFSTFRTFCRHVGNDSDRKKMFTKIVNKRCANLRRSLKK